MSSNYVKPIKTLKFAAEISNAHSKDRKLIIVEGKTDKIIYEKLINSINGVNRSDYKLRKIKELDNLSYSGCTGLLNILNDNSNFLFGNFDYSNTFKVILDGDARYIRNLSTNHLVDKFKNFIIELDYYSIESYAFSEKCLCEILCKYLDTSEFNIRNSILNSIYTHIIDKVTQKAFTLSAFCYLNENNHINNDYTYGSNECALFIRYKNEQLNNNSNLQLVNSYSNFFNHRPTWNNIKLLTKGKQLLCLIAYEIHSILIELDNKKLCENTHSITALNEVSCTLQGRCTTQDCEMKISSMINSNLGKESMSRYLYQDLLDKFDLDNLLSIKSSLSHLFC